MPILKKVMILLPQMKKEPISLLNTMYKLLSGTLAERLKPSLPLLINPDQKAYVPTRFIGECIRTTYDVLDFAKRNNKVGLLLLIDFEKALVQF